MGWHDFYPSGHTPNVDRIINEMARAAPPNSVDNINATDLSISQIQIKDNSATVNNTANNNTENNNSNNTVINNNYTMYIPCNH